MVHSRVCQALRNIHNRVDRVSGLVACPCRGSGIPTQLSNSIKKRHKRLLANACHRSDGMSVFWHKTKGICVYKRKMKERCEKTIFCLLALRVKLICFRIIQLAVSYEMAIGNIWFARKGVHKQTSSDGTTFN